MLRQHRRKIKAKRGPTKYGGICADAAALGVHRVHLYLVLSGKRESAPLLARYRALKSHKSLSA